MADVYVGIDVSKQTLEVVERTEGERTKFHQVANEAAPVKAFARRLARSVPAGVVFEATGGYERTLREALGKAEVPHTMVNPMQARHFAQYKGRLSKTDRIDADTLAVMAEEGRLDPTPVLDERLEACKALVMCRMQIVEMLTMEENRLGQSTSTVAPIIKRHIGYLKREQKKVEELIEQEVRKNPALSARYELLQTIKGIGPLTSAAIVSLLPEAGFVSNKQLAALVGVAPYAADSGASRGKRFIRGGRRPVRRAIYMAALVGTRCNSQLRVFYQRLLAAGKPRKLALVAVMNKLVGILNAVLRTGTPWTASFGNPSSQQQVQEPEPVAVAVRSSGVGKVDGRPPLLPEHIRLCHPHFPRLFLEDQPMKT